MRISIQEIGELIAKGLEQYKLISGEEYVEITEDSYWIIPPSKIFDFSENAPDFDLEIGSFEDEINDLRNIIDTDGVVSGATLQNLSAVLRYMSDRSLWD